MKGALRFNFLLSCLIFMFIIQIIIGFAFEQTAELMVVPNTNKMFSSSSLDGKHLIIAGLETVIDFYPERNATGYITKVTGLSIEMIDWLSKSNNFTFSPLQQPNRKPIMEGSAGLLNLLLNNECDIVASAATTPSRIALFQFSHWIYYATVPFVIPIPDDTKINPLSLVQPFQFWVWIAIGSALFAVLLIYYFLGYKTFSNKVEDSANKIASTRRNRNMAVLFYVLGLLLKQPGLGFNNQKLVYQIVLGTWCLATVVLGIYYTTLMTSFATAPNAQPLIRSIHELKDHPEIRFVTDKNSNLDIVLSSATSGFLKTLGNRLKEDPQSRCNTSAQCLNAVKSGNAVYSAARNAFLVPSMQADFKATGKCNFKLNEESLMTLRLAWVMQKNFPHTDSINKGIMRMNEAGLTSKWYKENSPDIHQCQKTKKQIMQQQSSNISPLNLKSLAGAFGALGIGFIIASIVLTIEKIQSCWFH